MEQGIEIIKLDIKGMTCAGCVNSVEKALVGVDGVFFAEVNFTLNRASVSYDPDIANTSKFESAIESVGVESQRLNDLDNTPEPSERSKKEY